MVVSSGEDALLIAQLTYLKEMDTGTKVFNKNKYEEMIMEYYLLMLRTGAVHTELVTTSLLW